jgi:hypothetical protein
MHPDGRMSIVWQERARREEAAAEAERWAERWAMHSVVLQSAGC